MLLVDLPQELHLQILEAGCDHDDIQMIRDQPQGSPRPTTDWHVFNHGSIRRLKQFCVSMYVVSKYWHGVIDDMSWCWFLDVKFPGFTFSSKYDIGAEIAGCKANLKSSKDCDINVTYNYEASYFGEGVVGTTNTSQLLLHALALLQPYANRIRSLHIAPWSLEAFATINTILKSFGAMPRLLAFGLSDVKAQWDHPHGGDELAAPSWSVLHAPQHTDKVVVQDPSLLGRVTWYETRFLSAATRMPANIVTLIADLDELPTITLSSIVEPLSQLNAIECLDLNLYLPRDTILDDSFTVSHTRLWTLGHLREFEMTIIHSKLFWAVMSRFNLPKLERLSIFGTYTLRSSDDCTPNPVPSSPISLPSLDDFIYYQIPAHGDTPLQYFKAPILKSARYVTNFWQEPVPPLSPSPAPRPTTAELSVSSRTSRQEKYTELIRLIAKHDLSRTHFISVTGEHSGGVESSVDSEDEGDTRPRIPFAKCIADWLRDPTYSLLGTTHSPSASKLRMLNTRNFDCIHVLFFVCAHLSSFPILESITLNNFQNCDSHALVQETHNDHREAIMSDIVHLEIDTQSLRPPINHVALMHPLSVFPNLQVLIINFTCEYRHCSLHISVFDEHQERLEHRDLIACLPQLRQLTIGLWAVHVGYSSSTLFHSDLRGITRALTRVIRRIISSRGRLGVPPIPEIYLNVRDWHRHTRRADPTTISTRLR
jgi:hypothetical protein